MNYTIITDEEKLKEFINWLPELEDNEKYYCSLFARKKYCTDLIKSNDKTQLRRFTSNKERLFEKIKQLEVSIDSYTLRERTAPQEALAFYINPNPRDMKKATFELINKSLKLIQSDANNYNIHAEALSCIQKSKSRSCYVDFDFDTKEIDFEDLNQIIPRESYTLIETRGGFHVLVDPKKTPKNNWYKLIQDNFEVDQTGDNMIPVPGTHQGGFTPKFII